MWIDLEMTGLDPETCTIVEIATIVTEEDLTVVAEGPPEHLVDVPASHTGRYLASHL